MNRKIFSVLLAGLLLLTLTACKGKFDFDFGLDLLPGSTRSLSSETDNDTKIPNPFQDVSENAWYAEAVLWCKENGILNGTTETTFSPDRSLTRAMTVTALYRAEGWPEYEASVSFPDNSPDLYYHDAILWAASRGIISGYSDGTFAPDQPVTREQLAAILWRNAGEPEADSFDFADKSSVADFAVAAVDWAASVSAIRTLYGNRFGPKEYASRADVASALYACLAD